jgi:integrase
VASLSRIPLILVVFFFIDERALSVDEQKKLLDALTECQTMHWPTFVPLLLLTGMRAGEALSLTWGQVDLMGHSITVGRAKTANGTGRMIPIKDDLSGILASHWAKFAETFGVPQTDHFIFAYGSPVPSDPTRHVIDIKHGWETLRKRAEVSCRLHDLRHTFATRLAENGVPSQPCLR